MPDANYTVSLSITDSTGTVIDYGIVAQTTTTIRVYMKLAGGTATDNAEKIHITIFSNIA